MVVLWLLRILVDIIIHGVEFLGMDGSLVWLCGVGKLLFLLLLHAQVGGAGSYRDIAYREKHQRIRAGLYI